MNVSDDDGDKDEEIKDKDDKVFNITDDSDDE